MTECPATKCAFDFVGLAVSEILYETWIGIVGVCAMEVKGEASAISCIAHTRSTYRHGIARSKPMRNILDRLISSGEFEAIIFGDKVILDEEIEKWPYCDFLISFFSKGFPLEKAIQYVELRKPFCVNELHMQQILLDRRLVLSLLDAVNVPTPARLMTGNDYPPLNKEVLEKLKSFGVKLDTLPCSVTQLDHDTIQVDGGIMQKPFVEKPVSGENHNVHIYYAKKDGGGVRKLFRKVDII